MLFPNITNKKVTSTAYAENTVLICFKDIEIKFSADKQGNLLINGIPKKEYQDLYDGRRSRLVDDHETE